MTTGLYYDKDEGSYMFIDNYFVTFITSVRYAHEAGRTYNFTPGSNREQDAVFLGPCSSVAEAHYLYPEYFI